VNFTKIVVVASLALVATTTGCASMLDRIGPRASFDLACPKEQLTIRQDGETTYIVRGCGGEAAYYSACESVQGGSMYCTWRAGYIHLPASSGGEAPPVSVTPAQPQ
jgi:hypothetical protein